MVSDPAKRAGFWLFAKDPALPDGGQRAVFILWNWLLPLLAAVGTGVLSLLLAFGNRPWDVFRSYFSNPLLVALNVLPAVVLYVLLYCAVGRSWLAHLLSALLLLGLSAANYYMLVFRDDPLLFTDVVNAPTALGVVGGYRPALNDRLILCIAYVLVSTLLLALLVRGRRRAAVRIVVALALLAVCAFPLRRLYSDLDVYTYRTRNDAYINPWSGTEDYLNHGFLYPFIRSVQGAFQTAPEGYEDGCAQALLAPYADAEIPAERKVNVVAVMLESFSDMSVWNIPGLSEEVYAQFHALEAESVSGDLIDNIFAGGTIDTERCFLTGSGLTDDYRQNANSCVWYLRSQGYRTCGSHPCYDYFYNRRNVNAYLGFEQYYFIENHFNAVSGGIAYDDAYFPELTRLCLEDFRSGPCFSFNISYQGHGPYSREELYFGEWVERLDYTQDSWMIMNNYFGSLKNTMERVCEMADAFRALDEPVVLVLFGDHKPWFGDANSVYDELGVNLDLSTEEGFRNYYTTRWLIWANDAAKAALGNDFCGEGPTLSPSFLMNELFRQCGWTGSAWTQYTNTVMERLPVLSASGVSMTPEGGFINRPDASQRRLISDFRIADYWYRHHFLYAEQTR